AERLLDLTHLGAGEVPDLEREALERGRDQGERGKELGMSGPRHDLRRHRLRLETEALTGDPLELGIGRGVRPDGSRELADPHPGECLAQATAVAIELDSPAGEPQTAPRQ